MAKRGRPRHPDILTPREWEVLALLREGLTNEQIAERLAITERTARYHVSEILSKLGVSSRREAAEWEPEAQERRAWWAVVALLVWRRASWAGLATAGFIVVLAAVGLLVWALVRTHEREAATTTSAQANTPQADAAPMPLDVAPQPAKQYVIVYVRPVNGPMADGQMRTVDAQTGDVTADESLDTMFSGNLVISDTPTATRLVTFGPLAGQALIRDLPVQPAGSSSDSGYLPSPRSYQGAAVIDDVLYQQEDGAIVGRDSANQIVTRYAIPLPLPPRGDEPIFRTTAIVRDITHGSAAVIVPTAAGHLLLFTEGLGNSVLVDLDTGARLDLAGYDRLFAATLAKDGYVYALVHNVWLPDTRFEVIKIEPVHMRIAARHVMDFNWRQQPLNGHFTLATQGGNVFVYLPLLGGASLLYHIDPATAEATLVSLPPNLGLDATVGVDGKIYFYGGAGENRVSRYDPATGQVETDVPELRAPEGTYVQAVLAR